MEENGNPLELMGQIARHVQACGEDEEVDPDGSLVRQLAGLEDIAVGLLTNTRSLKNHIHQHDRQVHEARTQSNVSAIHCRPNGVVEGVMFRNGIRFE